MTGGGPRGRAAPGSDADGQEPFVAALAGLPGMGPAMLCRLLASDRPERLWAAVRRGAIGHPRAESGRDAALFDPDGGDQGRRAPGVPPRPLPDWRAAAARIDPVPWWSACAARGIGITWPGRPDYPAALIDDPERPGALFYTGELGVLDLPCVAVVGTRNATPDGLRVAGELGHDLAEAGLCVVSGLALGIDGAAHAGALAAAAAGAGGSTVGVAASGVDVPYPRRHAALWRAVSAAGAVLSENLPGRPAQAWRFPSRNRVIAGLARMVVVVESHERGGSLITAEAALSRGIEVGVVPGSVHSPASAGSNQLLYDGPGPVRGARDVLDALGLIRPDPGGRAAPGGASRPAAVAASSSSRSPAGADRRGPPERSSGRGPAGGPEAERLRLPAPDRVILDAIGWRPATVGQIMGRTGLGAAAVAAGLDRLHKAGLVAEEGGHWARLG